MPNPIADLPDFFGPLIPGEQLTLHAVQNTKNRTSAISDEIARTEGYTASIRIRKRMEEAFERARL